MQGLTQEQLNKIAEALDVLAKNGLLYSGFRRKQRRVVEVHATKYIVVKYDDGTTRYLNPVAGKTYHFYIHIPPKS
jgi:hypothetical protein